MSMRLAAAVIAAGLLLTGAATAQAPAAAATAKPPSITDFFKRPTLRSPKLSPSGRYLAVQTAGKEDRMWLAVIDLETMSAPRVVASFRDADVYRHDWVNEERLVFQASESPDGARRVDNPGLWAVNRDGSGKRQLEAGAYPVWAPDGKTITYIGGVTADIFTRNADGTGTPRNISNEPGLFNIYPQISPDGKQVVYTVYAGDVEKYPGALKVAEIGNPSHVRTVVQASADVNAYKAFWLP